MIVDLKHLLGLSVETKSGEHIGRIHAVLMDVESQTVAQYEVRRPGILKEFLAPDLLVHRNQVLSLTKEKMVVDDLLLPKSEKEPGITRFPASSPSA